MNTRKCKFNYKDHLKYRLKSQFCFHNFPPEELQNLFQSLFHVQAEASCLNLNWLWVPAVRTQLPLKKLRGNPRRCADVVWVVTHRQYTVSETQTRLKGGTQNQGGEMLSVLLYIWCFIWECRFFTFLKNVSLFTNFRRFFIPFKYFFIYKLVLSKSTKIENF